MFRSLTTSGRRPLHRASIAGALAGMLLWAAAPMRAAEAAQDEVSRDFQKTLTLGSGQSLHIEHKFGGIKLHAEAGRDVKIFATIRAQASSHDEAQSFAEKIKIDVQQDSE
jgi:hypothetical protein